MTIQADDRSLPPALAGTDGLMTATGRYVHPATPVTVRNRAVPVFDVIADPVAGSLALVGEIDVACGQRFRDANRTILAGDATNVVVDLTRMRFIDASGIGLLIELRTALAARAATLRVVNADSQIGRVFSICGLAAMLTDLDTKGKN